MLRRIQIEEGWTTLFLVWAMLFVAGTAILQADLIGGLEIINYMSTLGLLAGLALSKSRFSNRTAHLMSIAFGLFSLAYFIGLILPGDLVWRERVFDMVNRQIIWIQQAFGEETSRDGLIFIMHTAAVFWILGYSAAWYTFRKTRIWFVVLPAGLVLLSVVYYYYGPEPLALYLAIYMVLALLFVGHTYLIDNERNWRSDKVRFEWTIRLNFLQSSLLAGVFALTIAWSLPALTANAAVSDAINEVNQPWRNFQDTWTRLFSSLRSYGTQTSDPYRGNLSLGGPRSVADTLVLDVYVPEKLPYVYWHAASYDTYQGGGWSSMPGDQVLHYPDDGYLDVPRSLGRNVITQTVVNYRPNAGTLYGAPDIVGSDKQMYVSRRVNPTGQELVSTIKSRYVLSQGDIYNVQSNYSTANATQLRQASTNYPGYVTDLYLQLPPTITSETLDLANRITAPYDNPFDKAIAVRDYLRNNISYNDQIDAPPEGIDPVHYTLFVLREGYCNYYASAMAVMLRAQGIPTRVAAGYAQGEWNEDDSFYRVRAENAHTWPEVYFPAYGWIQFEPTAAIPVGDRPEGDGGGGDNFGNEAAEDQGPELVEDDGFGEDFEDPGGLLGPGDDVPELDTGENAGISRVTLFRALGGAFLLIVAGGMVIGTNQWNRRIETDVNRSYGRLESWANWIGLYLRPTQTPYERATMLSSALPEGRQSIRNLTQQFVIRTFSRNKNGDTEYDPREEWKILRPIFFKRTLSHWFENLRQRNGKKKDSS